MRVLAISGSLRAASSNASLLRIAAGLAPEGMTFAWWDGLDSLPHFNPDLDAEGADVPVRVAAWRDAVTLADGVVISSPEYAHGVPGALKDALDWLVSTPALFEKPVVLLNAAATGGLFAQEALAETLRTMGARVLDDASLTEPFVGQRVTDLGLNDTAAALLRASMARLHEVVAARGAPGD